jgi:dipeptidyl aminopeptidase/acylaminoacyl peptidase
MRAFHLVAGLAVVVALPAPGSSSAGAAGNATKVRGAGRPAGFGIEHALSLRSFSELEWSRDGRRLAFAVSEIDTAANATRRHLWLADFASDPPRLAQLTRHPSADASPSFSPGGDTLAFVGVREESRRDPVIHLLPLGGGEPRAFGTYRRAVGEVHWSPDGRRLCYVMADTFPRRVREWRERGRDVVVEDAPEPMPGLWVVDLASGATRRLSPEGEYVWYARWSPDGRSIAYLTSPTGKPEDADREDIAIAAADPGATAPRGDASRPRKLGTIGEAFTWSPDSRWIALATGAVRDSFVQKGDVWVFPAASGPGRNLTASFDGEAMLPAWNATSDTVVFHAARGVTTRPAFAALAGGPVTLGPDLEAIATEPVAAPNGRVAWVQSRPNAPDEIWWAPRAGAAGRPLTRFNDAVAALPLADAHVTRWTSDDGVPVEGMIVRPAAAPVRAALPTLVMVHGGPWLERHGLGFEPMAQWFAARGYQVFQPTYRGSGGYGTAFMTRARGDWGGQDWRDVSLGIDHLVARGLADPRRLAIFGRSYGGYLTAWATTQTDRFDAACVIAGVTDLASQWGESDVQRYRAYEFGGRPWETPGRHRERSPLAHVARAHTPTLILAGENDRRTPMSQSLQLYRALRSLGVPAELARYPRESHFIREPRHVADQYERMLAWFDRWVRP